MPSGHLRFCNIKLRAFGLSGLRPRAPDPYKILTSLTFNMKEDSSSQIKIKVV